MKSRIPEHKEEVLNTSQPITSSSSSTSSNLPEFKTLPLKKNFFQKDLEDHHSHEAEIERRKSIRMLKEKENAPLNKIFVDEFSFRSGKNRLTSNDTKAAGNLPEAVLNWDENTFTLSLIKPKDSVSAAEDSYKEKPAIDTQSLLCSFDWSSISAFSISYRPFQPAKVFFEIAKSSLKYVVLKMTTEEAVRLEEEFSHRRMHRLLLDQQSVHESLIAFPFTEPYYSPMFRQGMNLLSSISQILLFFSLIFEATRRLPLATYISQSIGAMLAYPIFESVMIWTDAFRESSPTLYYAAAVLFVFLTWPFSWAWWIFGLAGFGVINLTVTMFIISQGISYGLMFLREAKKYSKLVFQIYSFITTLSKKKKNNEDSTIATGLTATSKSRIIETKLANSTASPVPTDLVLEKQ